MIVEGSDNSVGATVRAFVITLSQYSVHSCMQRVSVIKVLMYTPTGLIMFSCYM